MYKKNDAKRVFNEIENSSNWRTVYRQDYGRLIHSPAFRRLQGKTQLYPGVESDFFRNRLTHSIEVAQIAKSIAIYLNKNFIPSENYKIDTDICEIAGLAHDLGHPPFGHQGEEALDKCMGDWGGFEGNAQTLHILSKIEKKIFNQELKENGKGEEFRFGLNLTFRSLASIIKYDNEIPQKLSERNEEEKHKPIKGYYSSERNLVEIIKKSLGWDSFRTTADNLKFKTIECKIMDIADDIAYSTYDLEDGFKAGFYHPVSFFSYPDQVFENVAIKVSRSTNLKLNKDDVRNELFKIFSKVYNDSELKSLDEGADLDGNSYYLLKTENIAHILGNTVNISLSASRKLADDGYIRNVFTSQLIDSAINATELKLNKKFPKFSDVILKQDILLRTEILKNFTYESQILSPRLKVAEVRGKEIVSSIFECLDRKEGWRLLPYDYQELYQHFKDENERKRVICNFIAGMTDKYAIEFFGRLKSEDPQTIFKPF